MDEELRDMTPQRSGELVERLEPEDIGSWWNKGTINLKYPCPRDRLKLRVVTARETKAVCVIPHLPVELEEIEYKVPDHVWPQEPDETGQIRLDVLCQIYSCNKYEVSQLVTLTKPKLFREPSKVEVKEPSTAGSLISDMLKLYNTLKSTETGSMGQVLQVAKALKELQGQGSQSQQPASLSSGLMEMLQFMLFARTMGLVPSQGPDPNLVRLEAQLKSLEDKIASLSKQERSNLETELIKMLIQKTDRESELSTQKEIRAMELAHEREMFKLRMQEKEHEHMQMIADLQAAEEESVDYEKLEDESIVPLQSSQNAPGALYSALAELLGIEPDSNWAMMLQNVARLAVEFLQQKGVYIHSKDELEELISMKAAELLGVQEVESMPGVEVEQDVGQISGEEEGTAE